jgi:hypothetical protein
VLNADEIAAALRGDYELRGLELKGPGSRADKHFLAKVVRAGLSMGNLRDGGHVVIGIEDTDPAALLPGLSDEDLASWLAYDEVARAMANYADPPLQFEIAQVELASGATVAVIEVFEFADIPHLCARSYDSVLREGALYVRPRRMPETSEVASSVEMRDVIELATEKRLRSYVETAERASVRLTTEPRAATRSSVSKYDDERERGWKR